MKNRQKNSSIERILRDKISLHGNISIAEFVHTALFHEVFGYYQTSNPFGKDFTTSPEVSQLFGEMIAIYILTIVRTHNIDRFSIVEIGPGRGVLAFDIMSFFCKTEFCGKFSLNLVEISDFLVDLQKEKLKDFLNIVPVKWFKDIEILPNDGVVFVVGNEVLDCLKMRQFQKSRSIWKEVCVSYDQNRGFYKTLSENEIMQYPIDQPDGVVFEDPSEHIKFIQKIEKYIMRNSGMAIMIDYGYTENLFRNTIQSLYRGRYNDVFDNLGEADITHLVNFSAIRMSLDINSSLITQREFLTSLGVEIRYKRLLSNMDNAEIISGYDRLVNQIGELFKVLMFWQL